MSSRMYVVPRGILGEKKIWVKFQTARLDFGVYPFLDMSPKRGSLVQALE